MARRIEEGKRRVPSDNEALELERPRPRSMARATEGRQRRKACQVETTRAQRHSKGNWSCREHDESRFGCRHFEDTEKRVLLMLTADSGKLLLCAKPYTSYISLIFSLFLSLGSASLKYIMV